MWTFLNGRWVWCLQKVPGWVRGGPWIGYTATQVVARRALRPCLPLVPLAGLLSGSGGGWMMPPPVVMLPPPTAFAPIGGLPGGYFVPGIPSGVIAANFPIVPPVGLQAPYVVPQSEVLPRSCCTVPVTPSSPVPEPSTFWMFLPGALAVRLVRGRRG